MNNLAEQANEAFLVLNTRMSYKEHTAKDIRIVIATLKAMILERQQIRASNKYRKTYA